MSVPSEVALRLLPRRLTKWWPLAVWAVAASLIVGWLAMTAMRDRDRQLEMAQTRVNNAAELAAGHVLRVLEGADTALKAASPLFRNDPNWNRLSWDEETWQRLRDINEALSAVPTMFFVDPTGYIRLHAKFYPLQPVSVTDREYFQYLRSHHTDHAYLSEPYLGKITKIPVLALCRHLNRTGTSFDGLICATLDPESLRGAFSNLVPNDGSIVNLQRDDGLILVRHPVLAGADGARIDNIQLFPAIAKGGNAATELTSSPLDGVTRITTFRRLERFGLVVLAAQPVESLMAPWRAEMRRLSTIIGAGILLLTAAFIQLLRRHNAEIDAKSRLRLSEFNLSRAQAVAHVGSWHLELPGQRLLWSDETYRIFGLPPETSIDLRRVVECFHPEDRDAAREEIEEAIAGRDCAVEHRILVDGRVKWIAMRAQATLSEEDGKPIDLLGTVQDITERKLAETAMAESRALLIEVQAVAGLGYYVYDIPGDRWQSSEILDRIFGIDRNYDRSGVGWLALTAPDMRAEMTAYLTEIQAGAHDFDFQYRIFRRADNLERWVHGLGKIERDGAGKPLRLVGTIKDITEERQAAQALEDKAEELARSNEELEQFAYVASHDLREPLRMIGSYVGLLERRYGDKLDSEAREFIAFAKDGALRMDRLVLDLLEYSRIGRVTRPMLPVQLGNVIERAMFALTSKIAEAGAEIATPPEVMPMVLGDAEELTRLFQNLIGNAVKYREPDRAPLITLGAERFGTHWEITVSDNGIGIEPQYYERIFLIFQRLHKRTDYEGTGIGLAVCKKIVEHHGGRIWVESTPGKGTTFHVTLPAVG